MPVTGLEMPVTGSARPITGVATPVIHPREFEPTSAPAG
jgi:hypothetical protein